MPTTIIAAMLALWLSRVVMPASFGLARRYSRGCRNRRIAPGRKYSACGHLSQYHRQQWGLIKLAALPYPFALIVRYIGYETLQRTIDSPQKERITLALTSRTIDTKELVVTAFNAAMIMTQVIANKQTWWDDL